MATNLKIGDRLVGPGHSTYLVAELSANHNGDFDHTVKTIRAMGEAGADAVKIQTYTADTLTIPCDNEHFKIGGGTLWDGKTLHELYQEAAMPWEWTGDLKQVANELGMDFFSTPFDETAVDFLEDHELPVHKVASFELVDLPLLRCIAQTGKPIIASTGMATLEEIEEAVQTIRDAGGEQLALLKCTSAYPAAPEEMDLRTITDIATRFDVPVGLSDHTMGYTVPVAAVALGACLVEKHFTLSRSEPGPDSTFSMEPDEFRAMVEAIRMTEKALGRVNYEVSPKEAKSRVFRRSLFVVKDVKAGDCVTPENVRSIRPGGGLHTRHLEEVMNRNFKADLPPGTPLSWEHLAE
ncbi:MAG: pseudaminic acid synthase [Verrucomicrobiales bacterium]|nr:pseudaminic acid synthase [Verrucomicrobiales bacterium]